jgi:hypothetical protein
MRDPGHDAGAVAGSIGGLGASMIEVVETVDGETSQPMAPHALAIGDEADTARIAEIGRIIEWQVVVHSGGPCSPGMMCPECRSATIFVDTANRSRKKEVGVPVLIIGADTPLGPLVVEALSGRDGEVRAFVATPELLDDLRARGVKTALGDVSDGTHIAGAALHAFAAVLLAEAAVDDRERSFADTPEAVYAQWADGLRDAGVTRAIWVADTPIPEAIAAAVRESATVMIGDRDPSEVAAEVARLDEVADLSSA